MWSRLRGSGDAFVQESVTGVALLCPVAAREVEPPPGADEAHLLSCKSGGSEPLPAAREVGRLVRKQVRHLLPAAEIVVSRDPDRPRERSVVTLGRDVQRRQQRE